MKPHGYLVYLSPELYLAVVRLQADKQLGRSYPVLYALNEGLHKLGYITKEVYETNEKRYSQKLIRDEPKPFTAREQKEQQLLKSKAQTFSMVIEQWNQHPSPQWRSKWIQEARRYVGKVKNAELILALESEATKKPSQG